MTKKEFKTAFPSWSADCYEKYMGNEPWGQSNYIVNPKTFTHENCYKWKTQHGEAETYFENGRHTVHYCNLTVKGKYSVIILGDKFIVKRLALGNDAGSTYSVFYGNWEDLLVYNGKPMSREEVLQLLRIKEGYFLWNEIVSKRLLELADDNIKDWYYLEEKIKQERKMLSEHKHNEKHGYSKHNCKEQ